MGRSLLKARVTETLKTILAPGIHDNVVKTYTAHTGDAIVPGTIVVYDSGTIRNAVAGTDTTFLMIALDEQITTTDYVNNTINACVHGGVNIDMIFYAATPATAITQAQEDLLTASGIFAG